MNDSPRKGSLLVIFLTVFIDLLGFGLVLPLLPLYAKQYSASHWQLGALMASFSAMQFLFAPLWGRLSDRIGRRPVLMVGLAGSAVFYFLFAVASQLKDPGQSLALLFVARIGAGIAGATISTAQAYIADTTTQENRAKGMALIGMAFGAGFTFGPLLGLLAVPTRDSAPGPWPGYIAAALSLVALAMAVFRLPESKTPDSESKAHVRKWSDWTAAFSSLSIGLLLMAIFVCLFSFANFETTLSLVIKNHLDFSWGQVCLTYSAIGFTLALVQGGVVRRLAEKNREGELAIIGAVLEMAGFALMAWAAQQISANLLVISLLVVTTGFAFMQPNLNALLSRRSDPANQGVVLGVGQSVSALARILGAALGAPLLKYGQALPYYVAAGMMALGVVMVGIAWKSGRDYKGG